MQLAQYVFEIVKTFIIHKQLKFIFLVYQMAFVFRVWNYNIKKHNTKLDLIYRTFSINIANAWLVIDNAILETFFK